MATIPPMVHSISSAKPEVMSLTWNPRLVKTPTPTMSATTIDVAVSQDTLAMYARPELGLSMGIFISAAGALQGAAGNNSTRVSLCPRTNVSPAKAYAPGAPLESLCHGNDKFQATGAASFMESDTMQAT